MKFTSPKVALAATLVAVSAVTGTALAQESAPSPASAELLVAPSPAVESEAGPGEAATIAGSAWVPINPFRAWDSRNEPGFRLFSLDSGGSALALNVRFNEQEELILPANATGITYNATIVNQAGSAYLTVAGINQPTAEAALTSTVNWAGPGAPVANGSVVALGDFEGEPGYVKLLVGGVASGTEYIIDVTGYFVPLNPA